MKKLWFLAVIAAITVPSSAFANHLVGNTTPFSTRGACESFTAEGLADDRPYLLDVTSDFFDNEGELASFLTRAFTCELNESDGQWYIGDHRWDVLNSDWYQRHHQ